MAQGLACHAARANGPTQLTGDLPLGGEAFEWACAFRAGTQPTGETVLDPDDHVDECGTFGQTSAGDWTALHVVRRVMHEGTFATAVRLQHTSTCQ